MDRILEYVRWYGNFPFSIQAFGEADNLVFSALAYLEFPALDWSAETPTLRTCCELLEQGGGIHVTAAESNEEMAEFVRAAAASKRFGNLLVSGYVDKFYPDGPVQFSAVTFHLDEVTKYVAFRGTDSSIAGWKEDFMIGFTLTRAQVMAAYYLKQVIQPGSRYYVGGHSKGANLALYAAVHLPPAQKERLLHVFINDGPGFCQEVLDPALVHDIEEVTTVIRPAHSVVGQLFAPEGPESVIVKSTARGIMQHSIFSWGIAYGALDRAEEFEPGSLWIKQVLDRWLKAVPIEDRKSAAEELFAALDQNGIQSLTDLTESGPGSLEQLLISVIRLDPATRGTLLKIPAAALQTGGPDLELKETIRKNVERLTVRDWLPYAIMGGLGLLLVLLPSVSIHLVSAGVLFAAAGLEIWLTIRRLYQNHWNMAEERTRVVLCIILVILLVILLLKDQALFVLGSGLFGAGFLAYAYYCGTLTRSMKNGSLWFVLTLVETTVYVILGSLILIVPERYLRWYALGGGILLLLDSLTHLIVRFFRWKGR